MTTWHGYTASANVSLLFSELPYLDRFRAAADAGFTTVESWWPFEDAAPSQAELDRLVDKIGTAGVALRGLNFFAGDMPAGERGIASIPGREQELEASTAALLHIAERTGCRHFNLLYGQLQDGIPEAEHRAVALANYRRAAQAIEQIGGVVLIEPLAKGLNGAYPLWTDRDVLDFIEELDVDNARLLLDTFHLGSNDIDLGEAIRRAGRLIGHVQLADSPGRGEPGSGSLDFTTIAETLRSTGYDGLVAAEYAPTRETPLTLAWLDGTECRSRLA